MITRQSVTLTPGANMIDILSRGGSLGMATRTSSRTTTMAEQQFEELLRRNRESLGAHQPPPLLKQLVGIPNLPGSLCILTCSDSRVDPTQYLGLKIGEAFVLRNAGGRAVDALRSLQVISSIHPINLIVVVHHTDCGGLFTNDEEVRDKMCARAPAHRDSIRDKSFGTFQDIGIDESIREDVAMLKKWAFRSPETQVVGYALDIKTGKIRRVVGNNE
ncbi:carbonic anhydrase [Plectosphaerella cucumerina]|uniref:Carbonic anhydrase n=1 Tax=Plectosphaerella cucumerina TaxID=40658 RepID=A0A8K0X7K3_9PEZI|nr:carbonic anhydrase [Plectosphaerella cucumerina]